MIQWKSGGVAFLLLGQGCVPKIPATSVDDAIETYACAVARSSAKLAAMQAPAAPGTPPAPAVEKVSITLKASLAKKASAGAGTLIPLSLNAEMTDTRESSVTIELKALPTVAACDARKGVEKAMYSLDRQEGVATPENNAAKMR